MPAARDPRCAIEAAIEREAMAAAGLRRRAGQEPWSVARDTLHRAECHEHAATVLRELRV